MISWSENRFCLWSHRFIIRTLLFKTHRKNIFPFSNVKKNVIKKFYNDSIIFPIGVSNLWFNNLIPRSPTHKRKKKKKIHIWKWTLKNWMKQSREKGKPGGIPGISINLVPRFKERGVREWCLWRHTAKRDNNISPLYVSLHILFFRKDNYRQKNLQFKKKKKFYIKPHVKITIT